MKKALKTLKKYFIPHEENNHRPHLLRPQTVGFIVILAFVVESLFLFGTSFIAPHSKLFGIIVVNALVDETNHERIANDLATLHVNPLLQAAAQEKADDMVKNDYFAHTSPAGLSPWYWFGNVGYSFISAGENLAVNFSDSQDVTNAWMNSPEHRANILNNGFTEIGMATAQGEFQGRSAIYVVELFGTPAPAPSAPVAFVNTAAAQASASTPKTAPKPASVTPKVQPAQEPIIMTTGTETFVSIKGAETSTNATSAAAAPAPIAIASLQDAGATMRQSNPIQKAASDPRRIADYIYFAIIIIFGAALILNVFIKIHIQHPQLIMGGMLVILVAGLFIVLNQHMGFSAVTIL